MNHYFLRHVSKNLLGIVFAFFVSILWTPDLVNARVLSQDSEVTLTIVNASDVTICAVKACNPKDMNDCVVARVPIPPHTSRTDNFIAVVADIILFDCNGDILVTYSSLNITGQFELYFDGPDLCEPLNHKGFEHFFQAQYDDALQSFKDSLTCYQEANDRPGEGLALNNIGVTYYSLRQYQEALNYYKQALEIQREIGDRSGEGTSLYNIGDAYQLLNHYQEALTYNKQALAIRREIGTRAEESDSLSNIGFNYTSLEQYQEALNYYEQALTIQREIGDRAREANSLNNIGGVHHSLEQYQEALAYYEQALVIQREIADIVGEGRALNNIGGIYDDLEQYQVALDYYDQALTIWREIGDRAMEGQTLYNAGGTYNSLEQYQKALEYYEQALVIWREINDRAKEGDTLAPIGHQYHLMGEYWEALKYYEQALEIYREIGDRDGEGKMLSAIGVIYDILGQPREARAYLEQALTIIPEINDQAIESAILHNLGALLVQWEQYQEAQTYLEQALTIAREIGDQRAEGMMLSSIGSIYAVQEQYQDALPYFEKALAVLHESGNRDLESDTLVDISSIYAHLNQYEDALTHCEQALKIAREIDDRLTESSALIVMGGHYYDLGQYQKSLAFYEQGVIWREKLREEVKIEEWKSSFTAKWGTWAYSAIIKVLLELERPAEAFHYAQRGKARTFLDQIGNARIDPRATDDPALIAREQALLAEIRGLEAALSGRRDFAPLDTRSGGPPDLPLEQRREIQARLDAAYREYEHLLTQIKRTNPAYADLRAVDASTLITVQQTLPANTTLVEYYVVSSTQTLAFVVTQDNFHTVPLSVSVEALGQQIAWFRQFTSEEETRATAQTLYDWLFAPLREYIQTAGVLIAPHQQLHYLPFEALHDGERYLVEAYTLGYLSSASVLRYLDATAQGRADATAAVVLGNPDNPEVSALPGAAAEAQAVADLFGVPAYLNAEATEARLWAQASGARYLHIAAHGSFNPVAPQFSRLYLAPSDAWDADVGDALSSRFDGLLETREVWNLPLEDATLVTLSACQTQLGDLSAGDEWVGLSRAFLYAGTPSLVASLWAVEDASTAYLMTRFYGYLQEGLPTGAALRQAKLDTLAQGTWSSPYHWAAFTLIGDMGTLAEAEPEAAPDPTPAPASRPGLPCAAAFLAPLALLSVWLRRRW